MALVLIPNPHPSRVTESIILEEGRCIGFGFQVVCRGMRGVVITVTELQASNVGRHGADASISASMPSKGFSVKF